MFGVGLKNIAALCRDACNSGYLARSRELNLQVRAVGLIVLLIAGPTVTPTRGKTRETITKRLWRSRLTYPPGPGFAGVFRRAQAGEC